MKTYKIFLTKNGEIVAIHRIKTNYRSQAVDRAYWLYKCSPVADDYVVRSEFCKFSSNSVWEG